MGISVKKIIVISLIMFVSVLTIYSSVISPETGEKILYGKHPPAKNPTENSSNLEYSEIITSGNYDCLESASLKANENLSEFVAGFNRCNQS